MKEEVAYIGHLLNTVIFLCDLKEKNKNHRLKIKIEVLN